MTKQETSSDDFVEVMNLAGDGRLEAAMDRSRQLSPEEQEKLTPLLSCLGAVEAHSKQENLETASALLDVAVDLGLDPVDRSRWFGRIYHAARDPSPAIEVLSQTMASRPMHPEVPYRLALLLASVGRTADAWQSLSDVPREVATRPLLQLAECRVLQAEGRFSEIVERLTMMGPRKMAIIEEERLDLLTIALDRMGRGREAVTTAGQRRAMNPTNFDTEAFLDVVSSRVTEPLPALPVAQNSDAPKMLFVIAAFRSGTTLLEKLIADHPDAHGLGESELVRSVLRNQGEPGSPSTPDHESITRHLRERDPDAGLFVVKNIDLWFQVPRVLARFPNPRIILLTRDPIEIGLSMWKSSLPSELFPFLGRLEWIGWYLGICRAALEHWISTPGLPSSTIDYSDLTDAAEKAGSLAWKAAELGSSVGRSVETANLSGPRTISSNLASAPVGTRLRKDRATELGQHHDEFQAAYDRGRNRFLERFPPTA